MGEESSQSFTSPGHKGGIPLSISEKTEAFADSLEAQFQSVNDLSEPKVI